MGQTVRSEQYQNVDLLQQMTLLCQTVQNLGEQVQEGCAAERTRRQQDFDSESEKEKMTITRWKSDDRQDGRRLQQRATGQTLREIIDGLKNEENARQIVQNDLNDNQRKDQTA